MKKFLASLVAAGPSGLMMAALLDGAGLTIPGGVDALIIYLASQRPNETVLLAAVAVLGSLAGNFILFLLARRGGEKFLLRRMKSRRALRFRSWFHSYGLLTVFISALVPLPIMPMKIFVFCAGALGSNVGVFAIVFLGGRIPRYLGLAMLGRNMGNNALQYLREHVLHLSLFAVALFTVLYLLVKYVGRRRMVIVKE
jgi:uncharacterized membrane protein YdjX (TVP38/TMEM64 family)